MAFVLATGGPGGRAAAGAAVEAIIPGWPVRYLGDAAVALAPDSTGLDLGGGLVVGRLFAGRQRCSEISAGEAAAILASDSRRLLERYWGDYVALLPGPDGLRVRRAPLGGLAVYHLRLGALSIAVADPAHLGAVPGFRLKLSRERLALALLDPRRIARATGLEGVEELLPGEAMVLPGGTPERWWHPDGLAAASGDPAPGFVETLDAVVAALARDEARVGMLLSGGLDSSIVLSALVAALGRDRIVALHHHLPTLDPALDRLPDSVRRRPGLAAVAGGADELAFAQHAADEAGIELRVMPRTIEGVDFAALERASLTVAPSGLVYRPDADSAETRFVADAGLGALFTGRGGDQTFGATTSAVSAADLVRDGRWLEWPSEVSRAAQRSGLPVPSVAWASLRDGLGRPAWQRARLPVEGSFAVEDVRRSLGQAREPWDDLLERLPPGKARHLAAVIDRHAFGANPAVRVESPLACQPLVEACLAVPTYRLAEGGVSRGLARRAFAGRIPPRIAARLAKAGGTGFVHRLADSRRAELRERLLGGVLADSGLLDTDRLSARLAEGVPWHELEPIRLLDLLAVEAWARQWRSRGASGP